MAMDRLKLPFSHGQIIGKVACLLSERHGTNASQSPALTLLATNFSAPGACRRSHPAIHGKEPSTDRN